MIKILFILTSMLAIGSADDINIDTTFGEAKKSHKHVLIFLHKPDCNYCETMIEFTLTDEKIEQKIKKNFVFVDINTGDSGVVTFDNFKGTRKEFAEDLGYNFYPSSVFMDENKDEVYAVAGYKDEKDFLSILRFVESDSYEGMSIEDFK